MMNHTSKSLCKIQIGTVVEGKWHRNKYTIVKELGNGANGVVYLAQHQNQNRPVALKISDNSMSITSEVNVLKSFAKVQGATLGPSLIDVDDWQSKRGRVSFYTMEYITGMDFLTFVEQKGKSWVSVLALQLLNDLDKLHRSGWIFGDLKPENLLVTGPPPKIRFVDVGGTTIRGRAIKEFTEFYDRGYWGLGSRKAEPSYDLFAVAMVMVNTAYPKRFTKQEGGIQQLKDAIRQRPELLPLEPVILKALLGRYGSAKQMREDLLLHITSSSKAQQKEKATEKELTMPTNRHSQPAAVQKQLRTERYAKPKKKKKRSGFVETMIILTAIVLFYLLYLSGKLF